MKPKVYLYTDGSSSGNPGPGGYGTILKFTKPDGTLYEKEFSEGFPDTTNNRMELMAVIIGFEALTKPCDVTLCSDSKYVIDSLRLGWVNNWKAKNWMKTKNKPVPNTDLWKRLLLAMEPHDVTYEWVKGHDGHPENERCDKLATSATAGQITYC